MAKIGVLTVEKGNIANNAVNVQTSRSSTTAITMANPTGGTNRIYVASNSGTVLLQRNGSAFWSYTGYVRAGIVDVNPGASTTYTLLGGSGASITGAIASLK